MHTERSDCLALALKTLWGASGWPGHPDSRVVVEYRAWNDTHRRLDQLASVRASGVLCGPHGVGKSYLLHRWSEALPQKHYRVLRLAHSSLMGADLLRTLVTLGGKTALYRRGDNVLLLAALWQEWAPAWPVLVIEVAQDLAQLRHEGLDLLGRQVKPGQRGNSPDFIGI